MLIVNIIVLSMVIGSIFSIYNDIETQNKFIDFGSQVCKWSR